MLALITLATIGLRTVMPYPYSGFVFCLIVGAFGMFFFGAWMGRKGGENVNSDS